MNSLTIQNLSKVYPNGVRAIKDVSLNISNGMFGLLGANGAGKSSLMRTIAALQEPSEGQIFFNDENIVSRPDYVRERLGYLPQEFGVYPKISCEDLLNHMAILKGVTNGLARKNQIESLLHQTNLFQHRKRAVYNFSGGMKQRFGIAQALLGNPQLIIVDEPTAGLDPEERNRFLNLLSEIGENIIVILSTHIVEDVYNLCKNMAILIDGQIQVVGKPVELVNSIQGNVWTKIIDKQDFNAYKEKYKIISSKLISGETQIRVLSEKPPSPEFKMVIADLEDFYFATMNS